MKDPSYKQALNVSINILSKYGGGFQWQTPRIAWSDLIELLNPNGSALDPFIGRHALQLQWCKELGLRLLQFHTDFMKIEYLREDIQFIASNPPYHVDFVNRVLLRLKSRQIPFALLVKRDVIMSDWFWNIFNGKDEIYIYRPD